MSLRVVKIFLVIIELGFCNFRSRFYIFKLLCLILVGQCKDPQLQMTLEGVLLFSVHLSPVTPFPPIEMIYIYYDSTYTLKLNCYLMPPIHHSISN